MTPRIDMGKVVGTDMQFLILVVLAVIAVYCLSSSISE